MYTKLAIAINAAAILWALLFFENKNAAMLVGITIVIWFLVYVKKRHDVLEHKFKARFNDQTILMLDKQVMIRAQQSKGYSQVQGLGYLVLSKQELFFLMQLLDHEIAIPINNITGVETTNRLLGVSPGRKMLKISYTDGDGNADALALTMKDMDKWMDTLIKISGI